MYQNSLKQIFGERQEELGSRVTVMGLNSVMISWMEDLNHVLYEANRHEIISYRGHLKQKKLE